MKLKKNIKEIICEDYVNVFDNIKPLPVLPGLDGLPVGVVASYFNTSPSKISSAFNINKEKFIDDGVQYLSYADMRTLLEVHGVETKLLQGKLYLHYNGNTYTVGTVGQNIFPKKAILRLALVLYGNETANKIKEYLFSLGASDSEFFRILRTNREIHGDKTSLISDLPVIKGTNLCPPNMLNKYLGVKDYVVPQLFKIHSDEIRECGVITMSRKTFEKECEHLGIPIVSKSCGMIVEMSDGDYFKYAACRDKINFFTPKAALRIIMFANSEKAHNIQRQLREYSEIVEEFNSPESYALDEEIKALSEENERIRQENEKMKQFLRTVVKDMSDKIA